MAVTLSKGDQVNLTKDTGIKAAMIELGWDTNRYDGSEDFNLDCVLFLCDENKRCITDGGMACNHKFLVKFDCIADNIKKIVIVVTIYKGQERKQSFGMIDNAYIRLVNSENNKEVLRYDLSEDFPIQTTSVVLAEIYKTTSGDWEFKAVGEGNDKELADLCREYGIGVA